MPNAPSPIIRPVLHTIGFQMVMSTSFPRDDEDGQAFPSLTEPDIASHCTEQGFERGEDYYKSTMLSKDRHLAHQKAHLEQ